MESLGHRLVAPRPQHALDADVLHLNFPEHMVSEKKNIVSALMAAGFMLSMIVIMRLRRCPVIWTVHDVMPLRGHNMRLCHAYMAVVRTMVTGYIFLSHSSREKFQSLYSTQNNKPMLDAFHPMFPVRLLSVAERASQREKLGIKPQDFVIGYLGDIKPYKNPDIMRDVPTQIEGGKNIVLLVAGRADGAETDFENTLSGKNVIRVNRRLNDDELEAYIQAVDVVFLPYLWGWNSGFLFLVLACRQKSVTSNLPIFEEMRKYFGEDWIKMFDAKWPESLQTAINLSAHTQPDHIEQEKLNTQISDMSFNRLAQMAQDFYRSNT